MTNARTRLPRLFASFALLLLALKAPALAAPTEPVPLRDANQDLAFKVLQELAKEHPGSNIFISPFGISSVLQLVRHGARGQTRTELDHLLGISGMADTNLAASYARTTRSLKAETNILLEMANAVWFAPNVALNPEFEAVNRNFYGARVGPLDFTDPRATGMVNAWVSENTHGKIPRIFDGPLSGQTGAIVASALYFKGSWAIPFNSARTRQRVFHIGSGAQLQAAMMENTDDFLYRGDQDAQIVWLGYMSPKIGMYVLLPGKNSSIGKLLADLTPGKWSGHYLAGLTKAHGTIVLPRFKLEYGAELKGTLNALGLKRAFVPGEADFSGIGNGLTCIERVTHKSVIELDEKGTTAAAVTSIPLHYRAEPVKHGFEMVVDHPFLFAICDNATGTILFLGIIQEPRA